MIRTFHNIGQGAFYTEKFDGMTIVYDCGGSRKDIIEREILNTFEKDQIIEKLFISHFHNDHINGLQFLLTHCDVKTVYLPLLHEKSEVQFLIENVEYGNGDPFISRLITNPKDTIRELSRDTQIVFVKPKEVESKEGKNSDDLIDSGAELPLNGSGNNCTWVFVPYNFQYDLFCTQLCRELESKGIILNNITNELCTKKDIIIDVYRTVLKGTKNFNANSLVLYSGSKEGNECDIYLEDIYSDCIVLYPWYGRPVNMNAGCLYLGDYNVSDQSILEALKSEYNSYWSLLSTIQIPHHGSEHNFNSCLVDNCIFSIISAGHDNRYEHPDASTIKEIVLKRSIPVLVTEDIHTKFIEIISMRGRL